jgi:uncharacterized Zn-binding protein involved in type VI secretion
MPAMIVLGDTTDHGGKVIEASGVTDTHGKRIARVGDKVMCPKKGHGATVIVSGDSTMVIDGQPVAYHGCKTSCGATLISSQSVTTVEFGSGKRSSSSESNAQTALQSRAADHAIHPFDEQIRAVDHMTGMPIADLSYLIRTTAGQIYSGRTDTNGLCERVGTDSVEELQVWFGEEAEARMTS